MGITRKLFIVFLLFFSAFLQAQDAYVRHTVQEGETVYTIARKYDITAAELVRYNPDANSGLSAGDILVVPQSKSKIDAGSTEIITHTVKPKETLYGLSRQYNCSIEEIVALNPELKGGLKIGMIIKVPKNKSVEKEVKRDTVNYTYRIVEPKETVYSICKAAEITEKAFLKLNPDVAENGLQVGQEIRLPKKKVEEEVATDVMPTEDEQTKEEPKKENPKPRNKKPYDLYRIKPGDNIGTIARKFNCTSEELVKLNPELVSAVVPGRYIVVPVIEEVISKPVVKKEIFDRFWKLPSVYEKPVVNLAVLVPIYLDENDSLEISAYDESVAPIAPRSEFGLQFLGGVQVALDTLAALGYQVNLEVFDTRNDLEQVEKIAGQINQNTQLILGPLYSKNAERLAQLLPNRTIISPMSKSLNNKESTNLVDCINYKFAEIDGITDVLNGYIDSSNIVFVNLDTATNYSAIDRVNSRLGAVDSNWVEYVWVDKEFSQLMDIESYLKPDTHNVMVVIDQNPAFISDLMRKLKKGKDTTTLILGTSIAFDIPTLENRYLNNLNFIGIKTEFVETLDTTTQLFIQQFRNKTGTEPNRFGYTGYDTGLYFTQLLADYGTVPKVENWPAWRGINKGFNFQQADINGPRNNFYYKASIIDYQLRLR